MASIRGTGLFTFQNALAALTQDPERLDRERARFNESPPPNSFDLSGPTTRFQVSDLSTEERRRYRRECDLIEEHGLSVPYHQYEFQLQGECRRILKEEDPERSSPPLSGWLPSVGLQRCAAERVKKSWIEQGILKDEWKNRYSPSGRWKHEEPLKLESESETDSEVEPGSIFTGVGTKPKTKPRLPKSDEEMRLIEARQRVREREGEASRPYYQFVWQVSKARERIQDDSRAGGAPAENPADINTKAYEHVKSTWIKRRIWNRKWGVLPGMSWKHEHPVQELLADDPILAQLNRPEDLSREAGEAGEAPPRAPYQELFECPFPVESDHSQATAVQPDRPWPLIQLD